MSGSIGGFQQRHRARAEIRGSGAPRLMLLRVLVTDMKIYAMADLHLSLSTDKPMDVFGKRWVNHADRMKENWINLVHAEDAVLISGDISWGLKLEEAMPDLEWIHRLPGRKVLTRGNHDLWWTSVSRLNSLFDDMTFLQNDCLVLGDTAVCGTRGWMIPGSTPEWSEHDEKIYRREQIRLELALKAARDSGCRHRILSIHYPPLNRIETDTALTRLIEEYDVDTVVYGHLHGEDARRGAYTGVCRRVNYRLTASDQIGFCPVLIHEIGGIDL